MEKSKSRIFKVLSGTLALLTVGSASFFASLINNENNKASAINILAGDVNEDENCDINDIVTLKRYILSATNLTEQGFINADLNSDNKVNVFDLNLLLRSILESQDMTYINLKGDSISIKGDGATAENSVLTINAAGNYSITGTFNDGQIIVNAADTDKVNIYFNGVELNCSYNAPIYVQNADKTVITLEGSSENFITDSSNYTETEEEIDSAIYSKDDLTINGTGSLEITANYLYAINCKDDLKINGGNININSVDDAIRGTDSVTVKSGFVTIDSDGDGIKSTKGNVEISGGTLNIKASNDAIQAETTLDISDGEITACGDRGLTAVESLYITGGNILATATDNQTANLTSTQGTILMTYSNEWSKGSEIAILKDNQVVTSAVPIKKFTYVLISTPEIQPSDSYTVTTDNMHMKHSTSEEDEFTMTSTVTEFTGIETLDGALSSASATITFASSGASVTGTGLQADGSTITITQPGTYQIYGDSDDAEIIVDVDKTVYSNSETDYVTLVLNGVNLSNSNTAPINVLSIEDKCVIELADSTINYINDGFSRIDTTVKAAIYSMDDLQIKGSGTLIVQANYMDGIVSKDDLKIKSGNIQVTSFDDAIRGNDSVIIEDGTLILNSNGDAIKTNNTEDSTEGYIEISGGNITINSNKDGISADTFVKITGGTFNITTGGGYEKVLNSITIGEGSDNVISETDKLTESMKAIKATDIIIEECDITISSYEDAFNADNDITISGGTILINSGDEAFTADNTVTISDGIITVENGYEGIEGTYITISGGEIIINVLDDGLNGNEDYSIVSIMGGNLRVSCQGDGIDSNGDLVISDGYIILDVSAIYTGGDGNIDVTGTITYTGGTIVDENGNTIDPTEQFNNGGFQPPSRP